MIGFRFDFKKNADDQYYCYLPDMRSHTKFMF